MVSYDLADQTAEWTGQKGLKHFHIRKYSELPQPQTKSPSRLSRGGSGAYLVCYGSHPHLGLIGQDGSAKAEDVTRVKAHGFKISVQFTGSWKYIRY